MEWNGCGFYRVYKVYRAMIRFIGLIRLINMYVRASRVSTRFPAAATR